MFGGEEKKKKRKQHLDVNNLRRKCCREVLSRKFWEVLLRGGKNMDLNLGPATYSRCNLEQGS